MVTQIPFLENPKSLLRRNPGDTLPGQGISIQIQELAAVL